MKFTRNVLWVAVCLLNAAVSMAQAHSTSFNPSHDGFNFANTFQNVVNLPAGVNVRTGGLCGGMAYTALDYFLAHKSVPRQDYLPAEGTPLQRYIYDRQMTSLTSNIDKWAEVIFNPLGARDSEFFNWGLQGSNGGRLQELRSFIDRGMPVPLGLKSDKGGDHQVLAIGYDMGRYHGDLGANEGDLKIFVYDSNHPNQIMTLRPDVANKVYRYFPDDGNIWRTYFVDKNYHALVPPDLSAVTYPNDGLAHELIMTFVTGDDDLRGGNDNINLTINLLDGTQQHYSAINGRARWMSNTSMPARVVLSRPVATSQIRSLVISDTFTGGPGGDNWDMKSVEVRAIGGGGMSSIIKTVGFHRFTGDDKDLLIAMNAPPPPPAGEVSQLILEIRTGGDDLRGGNDNLNIETHFADGRVQTDNNVNRAAKWDNNTTHTVTIALNRAVPVSQITSVKLVTTFSGGTGGDNWNMDSIKITAMGTGVNRVIGMHGYNRFTGDARQLDISTH